MCTPARASTPVRSSPTERVLYYRYNGYPYAPPQPEQERTVPRPAHTRSCGRANHQSTRPVRRERSAPQSQSQAGVSGAGPHDGLAENQRGRVAAANTPRKAEPTPMITLPDGATLTLTDRKSTRLNPSHLG